MAVLFSISFFWWTNIPITFSSLFSFQFYSYFQNIPCPKWQLLLLHDIQDWKNIQHTILPQLNNWTVSSIEFYMSTPWKRAFQQISWHARSPGGWLETCVSMRTHQLPVLRHLRFCTREKQPRLYYSKTKASWHLWAEHEASSTMPNFHLRAVFFVMESNIAYNLVSKWIEYVL